MAVYSDPITYNSLTLRLTSINVSKVPARKKQVLGKRVVVIEIPGITSWEYEIRISGIIYDTDSATKDSQRDSLVDAQDGVVHAYSDGKHDGNYYLTDLRFDDSGDTPTTFTYRAVLISE